MKLSDDFKIDYFDNNILHSNMHNIPNEYVNDIEYEDIHESYPEIKTVENEDTEYVVQVMKRGGVDTDRQGGQMRKNGLR